MFSAKITCDTRFATIQLNALGNCKVGFKRKSLLSLFKINLSFDRNILSTGVCMSTVRKSLCIILR